MSLDSTRPRGPQDDAAPKLVRRGALTWLSVLALASALAGGRSSSAAEITWGTSGGGALEDYGWAVAADRSDNALVAGHFTGPANFGTATLGQSALLDVFVAKYDALGRFVWVRAAGGPGDDDARAVAADGQGNVFVTGSFSSRATFGQVTLAGTGTLDMYLAKYSPEGVVRWVAQAGGSGRNEGGGVAVDAAGNCTVTGYFSGTASFDATKLTSQGALDLFIARYDSAGKLLWARSAGGAGQEEANAVAVDTEGNGVVTGSFYEAANFDGRSIQSLGGRDVFLAKYDPTGKLLWVRRAGGADPRGTDNGLGVATDFEGSIFVTGSFGSDASFEQVTLLHHGGGDIFVAKYSSRGSLLWAHRFGGPGPDQGHSVGVDANGDVYVTGFFLGSVAFGPNVFTSPGHADVFVVKLDTTGKLLWALPASGSAYKSGNGIAVTPAGACFITGFFRGTTAFGSFTLTNNFSSNRDPFIARVDGPPSLPRLSIARAGNAVVVSWPASPAGFVLESGNRLPPDISWTAVSGVPAPSGSRRTVTSEASGLGTFYRLRSR